MNNAMTTQIKTPFGPREVTLRDGRGVTIREAVPDDAAAILTYLRERTPEFTRYIMTHPDEIRYTEQEERELLASRQASPGSLMLVVLAGGAVVAMLSCASNERRRRIAHVGGVGMSSAKAYWGSGLGTHMMTALIDWAESNPALGLLELGVYACNERARRLYQKCGFVEVGTIPDRVRFDDGTAKDEITMYRRVDGTLSDKPVPDAFDEELADGVVLRQVRYGDAERLWPLYDRNRERLRPWFRWAPTVGSLGAVRGAIAEWLEGLATGDKMTGVIEEGDTLLGMVYLTHVNKTDRKTELGYWLDAGQEGRGLVTAGCRALIRHAFDTLGVNRIDITADVNNTRSRAVAERLGFAHEADIRQWLRFEDGRYADMANYRLLREEWTH